MPKKIFELANEIGKKPLDLVEELKAHGFNVRNHMSVLSDDDITKWQELAGASVKSEDAPAKKKVTKKKKAKKKTAKKTTVRKKAASKDEEDGEDKPAKKTVTRKKKTVVRRKASSKSSEATPSVDESTEETTTVHVAEASAEKPEKVVEAKEIKVAEKSSEEPKAAESKDETEAQEKKVEKETSSKEKESDKGVDGKPFGLRIVSAPTKEDKEKAAARKTREANKAEEKPEDDINAKAGPGTKGVTGKKDAKSSRLSGLASMLSAKKNVNRSQALNEERATTELKSYAALQGSGRPMYTQVKRKRQYSGPSKSTEITEVKESKRVIKLHGGAYAEQLAKKLSIKLKDMIDKCLDLNLLVRNGDYIGLKLAGQIAALYDYRVEDQSFDEDAVIGKEELSEEEVSKLPLRAPVVTIMGHVDHGKTTLLDCIRNAKIADGEAGGITQHIGAYSVDVKDSKLTFLDTPGHAAFGAMRQRGADITDIVILIVAADDGVMPQTVESIKYIQSAGKPLIVAVNKMDREGANPDRIKQALTEYSITPEEWGGDTQFCNISALKGEGIDELLEAIALQAEILELRADPKGVAEAVVVESRIEHGRGPVATVLVEKGTLKKGDSIVVGETFGRARSLTDHRGNQLPKAGPSTPVQILGLSEAPAPGDVLNVVKNEREAKKIAQNRIDERIRIEAAATTQGPKVSLEDFFATAAGEEGQTKDLNLIIRADVQGSYEAIKTALESISNPEVEVKVIRGGVGQISDSDIELANTSGAFVIGFNMRPATSARKLSEQYGVDIKTYSIIYELINDVKLAVEGLLDPEYTEEYIGRAEVRDTFSVPKIGTIAGSVVVDGKIMVGCNVRLLREGKIMFDGKMSSLKRFKDDVKEVKNGYECGVGLENYNDIKVGDLFEAYQMKEKKRKLEDVMTSESPIL